MNRAGVLLDTGPLVALLAGNDGRHDDARELFASCMGPFRTCEAVVAEACFLLRRVEPDGPSKLMALARKGVFEIALRSDEHWLELETLLTKYADRPTSFADACLIRCAELHDEPRILTFDNDFDFYRWKKAYVLRQHWQVHAKTACPRDGTRLSYAKHLGRKQRRAFWCPACQKLYR